MTGGRVRITSTPEFAVAVFAFLLNFPWEFLQTPLYAGMPNAPHWDAIKTCVRATLGDVAITLLAFAALALVRGSRHWIEQARVMDVGGFTLIGLFITAGIEWLAVNDLWMHGWKYAPSMPTIPFLGVGLVPLLQWLVLPPLIVWFVKRQIPGSH